MFTFHRVIARLCAFAAPIAIIGFAWCGADAAAQSTRTPPKAPLPRCAAPKKPPTATARRAFARWRFTTATATT